MVAAAAIGILLTGISMIPVIMDLIPQKDTSGATTTVRIGVGLTTSREGGETGGNIPSIRLFDISGRDVGSKRGKSSIPEGGFADVKIVAPDEAAGRQAEYLSIVAGGNDGICVSYITATWPDGGKRAWYGDVGKECGGRWYASQTIAGEGDYRPACVWIDGDYSHGIKYQGLGIHITDFTATKERAAKYDEDKDTMCKSQPRFHMYERIGRDDWLPVFDPPLEYERDTLVDMDRSKLFTRGVAFKEDKRPARMARRSPISERRELNATSAVTGGCPESLKDRLITSKAKSHSAKQLCESQTSYGADFVSFEEKLFCDMTRKELWPLCDETHQSACFDQEAAQMRQGTGLHGRDLSSGRLVPEKNYTVTESW